MIKKQTELYTSNGGRYGDLFTKPIDAVDIPLLKGVNNNVIPIQYNIHTTITPSMSLSGEIEYSGDTFLIDIVEYNTYTQEEVILADINHRFNTIERDDINTTNRREGYYYKPFYNIPILEYSEYIEQGDNNTIGIPDYATEVLPDTYLWRDIIEKGYGKKTQYPFLNGFHYIYNKFETHLLRQDPYGNYGLYHGIFPRDPFGYIVLDNKHIIKRKSDGCK
jgi:hypothetical protein